MSTFINFICYESVINKLIIINIRSTKIVFIYSFGLELIYNTH